MLFLISIFTFSATAGLAFSLGLVFVVFLCLFLNYPTLPSLKEKSLCMYTYFMLCGFPSMYFQSYIK